MIRRTAFAVTILSTALAMSALSGCKVHMKANAGDEEKKKAPPPPPPPPAPVAKEEPKKEEPKKEEPPKAPPVVKKSDATVKGASVHIPGNIEFDTGKATLKANSGTEETLGRLQAYMEESKEKVAMLRVEGHTDNVGTPEANLELSGQRALTIKKWLLDKGIPAERLIAVGFGETKPVAPNTDDAGKAKNRRTEFKIAQSYDKKHKPAPYMGLPIDGGGKEFK